VLVLPKVPVYGMLTLNAKLNIDPLEYARNATKPR